MKIGRILLVILVILAIVVVAYWYVNIRTPTTVSTALTGSGTVETTEVTISPEVTGRVVDVSVAEGDSVKAGDTLFRLDDTLLASQRDQAQTNLAAAQAGLEAANTTLAVAQAAVTTAQAQYDQQLALARLQAQSARTNAWSQPVPSEFNQPLWYFTRSEEMAATREEVSAASDALDTAVTNFKTLVSGGAYTDVFTTETRLVNAQAAFLGASDVLDRAQSQNNSSLQNVAQQVYDASKAELEAAQKAYDDLITTQEASDIFEARAQVAVAQERYDTALDRYNALLTGADSLAVRVAADSVAQAKANVSAAESKVTQAQKAIDQAQAALNLVEVQKGKLSISAPADGVVLARNIEVGEVVLSGATALMLGKLDALTITVYIPENHYGEVKLGDQVTVGVDSFPTQVFFATVTRIADQAEFTPRNVQTSEGRQTTVFAIVLSVENATGLLKPGMPADVTFGLH